MAMVMMLKDNPNWVIDPADMWGVPVEHMREMLGLIPHFIKYESEADMKEQLEGNYGFGSIFRPIKEFGGSLDEATHAYEFPGDPTLYPIGTVKFRGEMLRVYDYGICILTDNNGESWWGRLD